MYYVEIGMLHDPQYIYTYQFYSYRCPERAVKIALRNRLYYWIAELCLSIGRSRVIVSLSS